MIPGSITPMETGIFFKTVGACIRAKDEISLPLIAQEISVAIAPIREFIEKGE